MRDKGFEGVRCFVSGFKEFVALQSPKMEFGVRDGNSFMSSAKVTVEHMKGYPGSPLRLLAFGISVNSRLDTEIEGLGFGYCNPNH